MAAVIGVPRCQNVDVTIAAVSEARLATIRVCGDNLVPPASLPRSDTVVEGSELAAHVDLEHLRAGTLVVRVAGPLRDEDREAAELPHRGEGAVGGHLDHLVHPAVLQRAR